MARLSPCLDRLAAVGRNPQPAQLTADSLCCSQRRRSSRPPGMPTRNQVAHPPLSNVSPPLAAPPCSARSGRLGHVPDLQLVQRRLPLDGQAVLVGQVQHADEAHVDRQVRQRPCERARAAAGGDASERRTQQRSCGAPPRASTCRVSVLAALLRTSRAVRGNVPDEVLEGHRALQRARTRGQRGLHVRVERRLIESLSRRASKLERGARGGDRGRAQPATLRVRTPFAWADAERSPAHSVCLSARTSTTLALRA